MNGSSPAAPQYFVHTASRHPLFLALGLLCMLGSLVFWINGASWAKAPFFVGFALVLWVMYQWFGDAIQESEQGRYGKQVDRSFRWSMSWFIFSEVAFFLGFFCVLFYTRVFAMPDLASLDGQLLWPGFSGAWPNNGPADLVSPFKAMTPWPLPTINTALLLASGVTLTLSHHALRDGYRRKTINWLAATVLLGAVFLFCQAFEYVHAYQELNLRLVSGAYGSTFFLLTGFHGFHVMLGACMLGVVLYRLRRGDFTPSNHFGFEGAAWYWHFVDVVWLGLYVVVYWL